MAKSIIDERTENLLLTKIKNLERIVEELKSNQAPTLLDIDGLITINQTNGTVIINDGSDDRILIGLFP